ncbi:MAG: class I SAM-dependent methyltransferase [Thermoanaerobaculia bacterium]
MSVAKDLYHRLIPEQVRNPIGLFRRRLIDRWLRAKAGERLPSAELLGNIQLTPWISEYLDIGERAAAAIERAAALGGIRPEVPHDVLDFGCGSGRSIRHLRDTRWTLTGCDIDREAIEWCQLSISGAKFVVSPVEPPLEFEDGSFDLAYAISVFTHFDPEAQRAWAREMSRILRPGGLLLVSTMGPGVIENFPDHATPETREILAREGSVFLPAAESSFNAHAAFHTPRALGMLFAPDLELMRWVEQGLDGFQDLSVLRKRG